MKQDYLKKKIFTFIFNMKDITAADYTGTKRVCKDFDIKKLGEYHDLCGQSNKLLLVDVFGNFRNICFKIHKIDPANVFFSS